MRRMVEEKEGRAETFNFALSHEALARLTDLAWNRRTTRAALVREGLTLLFQQEATTSRRRDFKV